MPNVTITLNIAIPREYASQEVYDELVYAAASGINKAADESMFTDYPFTVSDVNADLTSVVEDRADVDNIQPNYEMFTAEGERAVSDALWAVKTVHEDNKKIKWSDIRRALDGIAIKHPEVHDTAVRDAIYGNLTREGYEVELDGV